MQPPTRRRAAQGAVLALLVAAALFARLALGIDWNAEDLRETVGRLGLWAPAAFVLLVALRTPLLLPSQAVLLAGGLLFGTAGGTLLGALGIFLSGALAFGITRWLAGSGVRQRVPAGMRRTLDLAGTRGGAAILAVATAWPVGPLALYHAAAALTRMTVPVFLVALAVGSLPRAWTYSYFGSSLIEGRWGHVGVAALVVLLAMAPLLHPSVRRALRRQFEPDETPEPETRSRGGSGRPLGD